MARYVSTEAGVARYGKPIGSLITSKGGGRQGVRIYKDTLTPGLNLFGPKLFTALAKLMDYESIKVQDYMRDNAPWTDRTSNARNGLFAKAENSPTEFAIICYHTVPYGIFLEVKNSGEYAIIVPTLQHEGERVMGRVQKLMSLMS